MPGEPTICLVMPTEYNLIQLQGVTFTLSWNMWWGEKIGEIIREIRNEKGISL